MVADQIETVLRGVPSWVQTIVCVDDCSPDDAAARIERVNDRRVILLHNEKNLGVGGAVCRGYQEALRQEADILVKMDGDDQMDPAYLPRLLEPLLQGTADYTKGNRWLDARALRQMPWVRQVGNLILSFFTKAASGCWQVFDPCNGYTALRAEAAALLDWDSLADDYFFETSMLVELNRVGAVVKDVPIPARYNNEVSSLRIGRIMRRFPLALARAGLGRLWRSHFITDFGPFAMFSCSGLLLVLWSLLFGGWHWVVSLRTGVAATAGTVMLASLPFLVGFQLLLQALVLDITGARGTALCHAQVLPSPLPAPPTAKMRKAG
jgi:glycosyltransferase involved in cell wall biosynthesis